MTTDPLRDLRAERRPAEDH